MIQISMTAAVEAVTLQDDGDNDARAVLLVRPLADVPPPLDAADVVDEGGEPAWYEIMVSGGAAAELVVAHERGPTVELVVTGNASPVTRVGVVDRSRRVQDIDIESVGRVIRPGS